MRFRRAEAKSPGTKGRNFENASQVRDEQTFWVVGDLKNAENIESCPYIMRNTLFAELPEGKKSTLLV